MSRIVADLHELGRSDAWISKHLGMDKDEILRLKQITGLAALFKDAEFAHHGFPKKTPKIPAPEEGREFSNS